MCGSMVAFGGHSSFCVGTWSCSSPGHGLTLWLGSVPWWRPLSRQCVILVFLCSYVCICSYVLFFLCVI